MAVPNSVTGNPCWRICSEASAVCDDGKHVCNRACPGRPLAGLHAGSGVAAGAGRGTDVAVAVGSFRRVLNEWWQWLQTPASPAARRMGMLRESIALAARAQRCAPAWAAHLERSRAAVVHAAAESNGGCVWVLGSGYALDVPMPALLAKFDRVCLIDAVQPLAMRKRWMDEPRVQLVEADLTGVNAALLDVPRACSALQLRQLLAQADPLAALTRLPAPDFVASVNLLSQLPIAPVAWLARRCRQLDETALNAFAWSVIDRHLDLLTRFPAHVLIADLCQQQSGPAAGDQLETDFSAGLLPRVTIFDRWDWQLAPLGELPRGRSIRHQVIAARVQPHAARDHAEQ